MKALGSYFQSKREEQGYSLKEISRKTNIPRRYLKAIENQEFDSFPAGVYAKGFIRSYARALGLDGEAMVMEYNLNFEEENDDEPERKSTKSRWIYIGMLVSLLLLSVAVVVFRFAWVHPQQQVTRVPTTTIDSTNLSQSEPESSLDVDKSVDRLELQVLSTQKTYIFAIFDGMKKQEMVLLPGERRTWRAEETIRIRTGNAGSLTFYHQNQQLPPLGQSGEVIDKVIQLKDDQLKIRSVLANQSSSSTS